MNIRKTLIEALRAEGGPLTIDEIVERSGLGRKQAQDNLKAAVNSGLVERIRDYVTGLPAYRLTYAGLAWQSSSKPMPAAPQAPVDEAAAEAGQYYAVIWLGGGDATPEAAVERARSLAVDDWGRVRIIRGHVIGRIEARPVMAHND